MPLHTIPLHHCFMSALAGGLWKRYEQEPLLLTDVTVILPSRRLTLRLQEAFLRINGGKALLLPQLYALSDLGESMRLQIQTLDRVEQQLLITRLLQRWLKGSVSEEHAALLARKLISFLDEMQMREIPLTALQRLVPEAYAGHWQEVLAFLNILIEAWPAILRERGQRDPVAEQVAALRRHTALWQHNPPKQPVIAAGITDTSPAVVALLRRVLDLPHGTVLFHGVETLMTDSPDPCHPYYLPGQLLKALGATSEQVTLWPELPSACSSVDRRSVVAELFRPAALTHGWHNLPPFAEEALEGVSYIVCPTVQAEAEIIAVALRETLETSGKRAALVTQDRTLARYVASLMKRWEVQVNDSAGTPLAATPASVFLRLIVEAAFNFSPVALLALAKHPLAAAGMPVAAFRQKAREIEKRALRRLQAGSGWQAILDAVRPYPDLLEWAEKVHSLLQPLTAIEDSASLERLLTTHLAVASALAATDTTHGAARLWTGDKGEQTRDYLQQLAGAAAEYGELPSGRYPALFATLLGGERYYPSYGAHPRLEVLSPAEVRLQHYDRIILAELNEGSWPENSGADPWLSAGMRAMLGLPPQEVAIGQAAQDFAGCFCVPELILIRAEKKEGGPTLPSRFLARLETVLRATHQWQRISAPTRWQQWQQAESIPEKVQPIAPPAPCPPVEVRPRRLSVTAIEKWMRDPYALYAEKILGLKPVDPLDRELNPSDFGNFLHKTLEQFLLQLPEIPVGAELNVLLACGREIIAIQAERPTVKAFWWSKFEKVAAWIANYEQKRRSEALTYIVEKTGELTLEAPAGAFTLTAKADRIELNAAGQGAIVDYKTGSKLPEAKHILQGHKSQMLLEAYIAAEGGFGIDIPVVETLLYWHLTGKKPPVEITPVAELADAEALKQAVWDASQGLQALIAAFDDPNTPYLAVPNPALVEKARNDYAHLERVGEWR